MSIRSLELENFKKFSRFSIDLSSPVTVILGENSSGKSSILKALLGLKQTASSSNEHESWAAQGDYVDLGTYQDYINKKDVRKKLKIKLELGVEFYGRLSISRRVIGAISQMVIEFAYDFDPITAQARILSITCSFNDGAFRWSLCRQKTRKNYSLSFSQSLVSAFNRAFPMPESERPLQMGKRKLVVAHNERFSFTPAVSLTGFAEQVAVRIVSETLSALTSYLDKSLYYLAPLRSAPYRSYARSSHSLTVGVKGEYTPSVLANLERRTQKVTRGESQHTANLELLGKWVNTIFPGYRIRAKTLDELVKLYVSNSDSEGYVGGERADTLTDVGFGFSQVIPILVQLAVMPVGSTLIIEQPELHLHPMAQTRLASVVADAAKAGRRVIIETHSEHFVRGLQLAVSESRGKPREFGAEMLAFFYLKQKSTQLERMWVSAYGEFDKDWPPGFFDESYRTLRMLLRNKLQGGK